MAKIIPYWINSFLLVSTVFLTGIFFGCVKEKPHSDAHDNTMFHFCAENEDFMLVKSNQHKVVFFEAGTKVSVPDNIFIPANCEPKSILKTPSGYNLILETEYTPYHTIELYVDYMKKEGWEAERLLYVSDCYSVSFKNNKRILHVSATRKDLKTKVQLTEIQSN